MHTCIHQGTINVPLLKPYYTPQITASIVLINKNSLVANVPVEKKKDNNLIVHCLMEYALEYFPRIVN